MKTIWEKLKKTIKHSSPPRLLATGFGLVIFIGTILLMLPISVREGMHVTFVDALFTSTSAVCVTGLIAIDTATYFTPFGSAVIAILIQVGGLGVTCVGVSLILAARKHVSFKARKMIKESWNVDSYGGLVRLVRSVLKLTLIFEITGALLSFINLIKDYDIPQAIGISIFHSIAAFNNSGFDIQGGLPNMMRYQNDVLWNLVTSGLIIFGGIGFLVINDVIKKRNFRKLTLHSKVVISMSIFLIILGTVALKCSEDITWLGAYFHSVSARTAGFSTYSLGDFSNAGLFIILLLMFIGASPGSTGGGIKTSTLFVMCNVIRSVIFNKHYYTAFRRRIADSVIMQAFVITLLSFSFVAVSTLLLCILEPNYSFMQLLFESVSGFGTVGLSTGITADLGAASKIVLILTMYVGRLGAMTIATLGNFKEQSEVSYTTENITIG